MRDPITQMLIDECIYYVKMLFLVGVPSLLIMFGLIYGFEYLMMRIERKRELSHKVPTQATEPSS